jgi:hypothetical protein
MISPVAGEKAPDEADVAFSFNPPGGILPDHNPSSLALQQTIGISPL